MMITKSRFVALTSGGLEKEAHRTQKGPFCSGVPDPRVIPLPSRHPRLSFSQVVKGFILWRLVARLQLPIWTPASDAGFADFRAPITTVDYRRPHLTPTAIGPLPRVCAQKDVSETFLPTVVFQTILKTCG
ncbi:hypothetical protein NLI96_g11039 [Meripilus lineatus]|uniref:Uncharacterized protein n=1 Tax=Meripilus lineatus TaxID=2056292 RepID=A0AAD5UWR8_9APHY|nr:hypothetical protein NLI96_g11039 [Physisporinus lineatus]